MVLFKSSVYSQLPNQPSALSLYMNLDLPQMYVYVFVHACVCVYVCVFVFVCALVLLQEPNTPPQGAPHWQCG